MRRPGPGRDNTAPDLQEAVEAKLAVNQARVHKKVRDGIHVKEPAR
jgi:hypothetical protein